MIIRIYYLNIFIFLLLFFSEISSFLVFRLLGARKVLRRNPRDDCFILLLF